MTTRATPDALRAALPPYLNHPAIIDDILAALAAPSAGESEPHPVLVKYGLEHYADDPLEVLDRHLSNNHAATVGAWRLALETWKERALRAEAAPAPTGDAGLDPTLMEAVRYLLQLANQPGMDDQEWEDAVLSLEAEYRRVVQR